MLQLQQSAGNQAVTQLLGRGAGVQRKLAREDLEIEGGHYSPEVKKREAEHPAGLILTIQKRGVGRREARLSGRAPAPILVSKEWTRFGNGKLGQFVGHYNDFTQLFGEVVSAIGRLQDLLSAGAPEVPEDMTPAQERSLRPTDDSSATSDKKEAYDAWRTEQARYATDTEGVPRGLAFDVGQTHRTFSRSRQKYWQAGRALQSEIEKAKALARPTVELELTLGDMLTIAEGVAAGTVSGGVAAVVVVADKALDARKQREEYDKKMAKFTRALKGAGADVERAFEAFQVAGSEYWDNLIAHRRAEQERDDARGHSRQLAGLVGQRSAKRGTTSAAQAELRMPTMVADAWHALAVTGPPARASLRRAVALRSVVEDASRHDLSWRPGNDPSRRSDISQIRDAIYALLELEPVLDDEVGGWQEMSRYWQERLAKFYR